MIADQPVVIGASIGISVFPFDAREGQELLRLV